MQYVLWANIAVWLGMGLFVLLMWGGQKRLERRLNQLEIPEHGHDQ